eukprot:jgi/Undpi1/9956/HiC_scaffold_28.g12410.m1
MMRSNLVKLMVGPSPEAEAAGDIKGGGDNAGDEKRRRLIVDLDPPRFARFTGLLDVPGTLLGWGGDRYGGSNPLGELVAGGGGRGVGGGGAAARELEETFRTALNEDQRAAVRKLVTAKDYALMLGMPGTGKTWTIAFAVRVLLARGASVLITSYTHSAVDNLLLKLIEEGVPCLRVGRPASVHPGVQPHCVNYDGSAETTAAYSELVASAKVVGCTCLGVKHPLFSHRRFDYCVVDEAGQISQPVVLAPLRCADVFVLVGDHYQLPPLVTSSEALEAGMSESLFRRLCEAHPTSLQRLSYQYRMNGDVMALCNDLTYSGRLRCGNAQVENQRLVVHNLAAIPPPTAPGTPSPSAIATGGYRPAGSSSSSSSDGNNNISRNNSGKNAPLKNPAWQGKTPPCKPVVPSATARGGGAPEPWLTSVLCPDRRVVFLDTDALSLQDGAGGGAQLAGGGGQLTGRRAQLAGEGPRLAAGRAPLAGGGGRGGGGRAQLAGGGAQSGAGGSASPWQGVIAGASRPFVGLEVRSSPSEHGEQGGGTLVNAVECDLVRLLAWGLDVAGFDLGEVGVISPYRSQVQLLQAELKPSYPSLEINTIDKYQGRDKEVIVVSFVRSNAEGTVGHLLRDWRRLNVALSRAKRKLVLVGSLRTLSSCAILSSLAGILKTRGWVYPLPQGAHRVYPEGLLRSSGGGYDREGALTEGGSSGVCGGRGELVPEMHAKSRRGQHNSEMYGRTRSEQDDRNRELRLASQCEGRGAHGVDAGGARGMDGGGGGGAVWVGVIVLADCCWRWWGEWEGWWW